MKEYYKILEIQESASPEEIKKSFRKLSMKYHPDTNGGSKELEEKFKKIQEAYSVLSDPEKKKNYDAFGTAEPRNTGFSNGFGFDDIFKSGFDPFSNFHQPKRKTKGGNIQINLSISFDESVFGKELDFEIKRREKCDSCSGTGNKNGKSHTCPTCNGSGQIGRGGGFFSINMPCPECNGSGNKSVRDCDKCRGFGFEVKNKKIHIKIKPGLSHGDRLLLKGQGHQNADIPGDVIIVPHIQEHEYFKREGNDILMDVPISYIQAVLGDKIEVPTLTGKAKLTIPGGSEPGKILRLSGAGINGGSMYVRLNIDIPKTTNENYKKILQELEKAMPSTKAPMPKKNK